MLTPELVRAFRKISMLRKFTGGLFVIILHLPLVLLSGKHMTTTSSLRLWCIILKLQFLRMLDQVDKDRTQCIYMHPWTEHNVPVCKFTIWMAENIILIYSFERNRVQTRPGVGRVYNHGVS
uniref:Uncharacterized protein n=1 Tax=Setaria viridis TaxID=4556 RepID=A0A4V6D4X1_SETVI|nr:hypothetical protein SEVIR_6G012600v2 [Setaria viridis]